ncbi:sugar ABC transporter permease [Bacillus sp. A053]|uniref:Maltose/maltodextrin transport system permease protein n=1 Tax=Bacillus stercoris TaxID=2054641 RepID=A0ABU0VAN4_9BACI|nr:MULTISPECIES: maltodextrin ABC transporter permease MdxF [Bacillus]NLS42129.1 sugar ABC transporter permease [Bacillus subtilis]ASB62539.1 sugar ABC transporter permease [Bacillus sp. MD-5]KIH41252.1 sugar ABC transporter permease [Bacillus sp. A053]MCB7154885.1 maltodextrin ABC transporter permease MdxF [Bacillus stercoris]MDN0192200.1 maltodextrin ABC transporter permease MdxF [Bacillus sp. B.PNR1]
MNKHHTLAKQKRKAGLLSIIPGLGQIANQQLSKGLLFLAITGLFAFELCVFGIQALTGLMTLGSVAGEDHSLFMLIEGTLQLIVTVIFLMFYIFNIHDSRKTAAMKAAGLEINTSAKDMLSYAGDKGFPYLFTLPAYIMMVFVIIFPVLVTLFVACTNYDFYHIPPNHLIDWVGFKNFLNIFFLGSYRETFVNVLGWTVIWTICATTLQIILGIVTALFVNQDFIKGKRIFRMIFLFPWAVPAFITIMSFSNMFNDSIGAVNAQVIPLFNHLPFVELPAIAWKTDPFWTKTALIMIQTWLGFPYIYVMVTGVLQAIPGELYEAAKIDGATFIQRFRHITFPMILFATAPVMITQYTFNFNNFSIIYLFNEGGPGSAGAGAGSTDILISWIYKLTTGTSPQYSVAAAVTLLISFIVIGISLIAFKKSNAFGNEEVM